MAERLDTLIRQIAEIAFGIIEVEELNELRNQQVAVQLASKRALQGLSSPPDHVLFDGGVMPVCEEIPWTCIPKVFNGTSSLSIAAASIVASVRRRHLMREADQEYPSPAHLTALTHYGPCPLHHQQNKIIRSLISRH